MSQDEEKPAGPSQPIRRISTMPAPKSVGLVGDWEYCLQIIGGWDAARSQDEVPFISRNEGEDLTDTLKRLLEEGQKNTATYMSGHACPIVFGTARTSKRLIEVYVELGLRMPGMHSPLDGLRLTSDGEHWMLRSLLEATSLPSFAKVWRSGRAVFHEARTRAGSPEAERIAVITPDQVPTLIDWMCMEAQRLDPILRAIFDEQP